MEYLSRFTSQIRNHLLIILVANNTVLIITWWLAQRWFNGHCLWVLIFLIGLAVIITSVFVSMSTLMCSQTMRIIHQAILHVTPDEGSVAAPDTSATGIGRELIT